MLDRLEQGVREKHRLVADASHELRTPLAVMRAELDVSLRGDDLSPAEREVLESLREEVDRLGRMADDLLVLAQADEGRLPLLTRPIALGEAVESAVHPLRPLAEAKGVRLEVQGSRDARRPETEADPERLRQVLTNLLDNAIAFTPRGGVVRVEEWARGGDVGVTVTDDGPGIPPEARPRVFDRFYRVDPSRAREGGGTGLGLAICSEIARAHGGRVWVESVDDHGSAFSIALPSRQEAEQGQPQDALA
jgi:signal transduction histidine kinase